MTYYDHQFKRLKEEVPADLKLQNLYGETHWISVSPAEIRAILEILNRKEVEA